MSSSTVPLKVLLQGPYASPRARYRFEREVDLDLCYISVNPVHLRDFAWKFDRFAVVRLAFDKRTSIQKCTPELCPDQGFSEGAPIHLNR
ncbi:MAG: hypothetical protein HWN51_02585 [Desulfobacterales bacterium]|nr:hypothetical protein [Desulfobacterales bacterium]